MQNRITIMNKKITTIGIILLLTVGSFAQSTDWPVVQTEAKPGTRWWWMGSAVDQENLSRNLDLYSTAGLGSLEITPIYGVKENEANEIPYLSAKWMEMLKHTEHEADAHDMFIDMNTGTGWPFGGPEVSIEDAASKLIVRRYSVAGEKKVLLDIVPEQEKERPYAVLNRLMAFSKEDIAIDLTDKVINGRLEWQVPKGEWELIAVFCGKTLQKVKRAAPGAEGYVINHFNARAVARYLHKFEKAFQETHTAYPHNFFNDSYEVYQADWTEDLLEQFAKRRGYKLENYLPVFLSEERTDEQARIISDYRETISELLQENFTQQWTEWAHKHGSKTRNQAHGSPGNLIDIYASVDVPECEGFGLSDFNIRGLRKDSLTRPNDSDISMLKYASSAAHIAGKPYTSSETFTWLTEHFRTSLSQCKPDMDLMFLSGVNRMYFHGTTYSPLEAEWPGWKFYASIDMSPTNSIWKDAPAFFDYITRCQSFLQIGKPDNDFLLYLPVYDMWHEQPGRLLMFDIHGMKKRAPRFIEAVNRITNTGYDVDYISDQFILSLKMENNKLKTTGGNCYKALIIPGARLMPHHVLEKIRQLADEGATIVFLDHYPEDVPGFGNLSLRRNLFRENLEKIQHYDKAQGKGTILFGTDYNQTLTQTGILPEKMKIEHGLSYLRRNYDDGSIYFISALKDTDMEAWIPLNVLAKSIMIFNPMNGKKGKAQIRTRNGATEVYLQLASGESVLLKTFSTVDADAESWRYLQTPTLVKEQTVLENTTATGHYTFNLEVETELNTSTEWILDLGDVRESARVYVNGCEAAILWAVPFRCVICEYLKQGENTIEIDVTGLPANRIADMDRKGIIWRKFKDINIVDIYYKQTGYAHWQPVPIGLLEPVKIYTAKVGMPS